MGREGVLLPRLLDVLRDEPDRLDLTVVVPELPDDGGAVLHGEEADRTVHGDLLGRDLIGAGDHVTENALGDATGSPW